MEKRALQASLFVLSLVPLVGMAISFTKGAAFYSPKSVDLSANLDNQLRYLSGVYIMVTVGVWWCLRDIEARGAILRLVGLGIVVGAIGRVISMLQFGLPPDPTLTVAVGLELVAVPILVVWQMRIARLAQPEAESP